MSNECYVMYILESRSLLTEIDVSETTTANLASNTVLVTNTKILLERALDGEARCNKGSHVDETSSTM